MSNNDVTTVVDVNKEDDLSYDIGNLLASDSHDIDIEKFNKEKMDYLIQHTRDNVQLLINRIFVIPSEQMEDGLYVTLPALTSGIPREKPLPKPKALTTWEKYAKAKGIKNKDREKFVYDEVHDEFRPRFGWKRANNPEDNWVLPAKPTDEIGSDPFMENRMERKKKLLKQKKNEIKNSTRAVATQRKLPGSNLATTYDIASFSTASMGKFDKKLKNEPKRNEILSSRKNKALLAASTTTSTQEKDVARQVLSRVLKTEAKRREKVLSQSAKIYQKATEKAKRKEKKVHLLASRKDRFAKKQKTDHTS